MPDSGKDLGLDLFELYKAGKQHLPHVASEYTSAGASVSGASSAASCFQRHQIFGGTNGPAFQEWNELRDTVQTFLNDTGNNLNETGQALVLAADTYSATDSAARDELERLKRENGLA